MDNKYANKKCFVIMPFGKKKEKRPDGTEIEIDFNYVYHELIKVAVESLGIECDRCDEIIDTGSIHAKMFHGIFEADVAVVDVSFLNPNVYYELGVRHALNKHTTLVIRKNSNQPPPFNINGLNILGYDIDNDENLNASRKMISEYVKNGLEKQSVDSLVHEYLDNLKVERKPKKITAKERIPIPDRKNSRQGNWNDHRRYSKYKRDRCLGKFRKYKHANGTAFRSIHFSDNPISWSKKG